MKKNLFLLGIVLMTGVTFIGCTQRGNAETGRVEQVQDENSYEMQPTAPKEETGNQKEAQTEEQAMKEGLLKEETPDSQPENLISKEEALTIVLNKVSGATEANTEIELDYDDGYWKYEGEIHHNGKEYEFELNAKNGTIMKWTEESWND